MAHLDPLLNDLVIANRILAHEDVVDAYGHVSVRHPDKPDRFFLARSLAPELVTHDDIVEFTLDGKPVREESRALYLERFIHGGIFEARPDVMAVVHAHAEDILPFGIVSATPLRPVIHSGSFLGAHVPIWDIADKFGDTNLLVANVEQARDLAKCLGAAECGADARPWFRGGRALAHRGGADVGLFATQCAGAFESASNWVARSNISRKEKSTRVTAVMARIRLKPGALGNIGLIRRESEIW